MTKLNKSNYKFWHSPFALGILFIVLVLFGYKIIDLISKERETAHRKELIQEEIEELKQKASSLSLNISRVETEEGKEEVIREKYQVAKEGEKMVIIVEGENKSQIPQKEEGGHGFWNWIKNVIKN